MKIGMLWLDTNKRRTLEEKVHRAVDYYEEKYGRFPELCLVNNQAVSGEERIGEVIVQPIKHMIPHHFWLGMSS